MGKFKSISICILVLDILILCLVVTDQSNKIQQLEIEIQQETKVPDGFNVVKLDFNGYADVKTMVGIQSISHVVKSLKTPVSRSISQARQYTEEDIILMAMLVHAEAEGEPLEGKTLVASVVMNRQKVGGYYGDTIKQVIFKKGQFDGIKRDCFKSGVYIDDDIKAVREAQRITNRYMFFANLNTSSDSEFINSLDWTLTVGNHSFAEGKR